MNVILIIENKYLSVASLYYNYQKLVAAEAFTYTYFSLTKHYCEIYKWLCVMVKHHLVRKIDELS